MDNRHTRNGYFGARSGLGVIVAVICVGVASGCHDSSGETTVAAPLPAATAAGFGLDSVLDSLNGTWMGASKSVQDQVAPHAEAIQSRTKEEMEKLYKWEYRVVELSASLPAAELEGELGKLGNEGWDCLHFLPKGENLRITCKRRPRSALDYLKYVPGL